MTYLLQQELADRWRLSVRTIERWRWSGDGPIYLKVKGKIRYRLEDVLAFEAANFRHSTTARVQRSVDE